MDEFRKEIIFDYNIYNLRFCQEKNFSAEQVSTYMSIINFILVNSLKRKLSQNDSYEILEKLVSRHAHQCPPYAEYFFTDKDKVAILKNVRNLYKYYLMYEICLTKFTDYNIISVSPFTGLIPEMDLKEGSAYSILIYFYQKRFGRSWYRDPVWNVLGRIEWGPCRGLARWWW